MISYDELLQFRWPSKASYQFPKRKKRYKYLVIVINRENPDIGCVFHYSGERRAKAAKRILELAKNNIEIDIETQEMPVLNSAGFIK